MVNTISFYFFSIIIILSSIKVITSKNPVQAVLFLVLSFFTSACLWILLNAEFLAITLVLVYVGAVMVLFIFVVMMLEIKNVEKKNIQGFVAHSLHNSWHYHINRNHISYL